MTEPDSGEDRWSEVEPAPAARPDEEPHFADLDEFVVEYFSQLIRRRLDGQRRTWCPAWWKHPEAIARLDAVWRSWEHLRLEPLGLSQWWTYHADPHLAVLLDADDGPFAACDPVDGHTEHPLPPLPIEPSDPTMWLGTAFSVRPREAR